MVTSSCPDAAHSIFASEKFFGLEITVYSLFGPPTLFGGGEGGSTEEEGRIDVIVSVAVEIEILVMFIAVEEVTD